MKVTGPSKQRKSTYVDIDGLYVLSHPAGMFVATERTEGVSTSDIVARIVRNYDIFCRRNLARGYSRKDLNISFLRGQKIKLQNKVDEVKEDVRQFVEKKKDEVKSKWEETSKEVIGSFLSIFGGPQEWNWASFRRAKALASPNPSDCEEEDDSEEERDTRSSPKRRKRASSEEAANGGPSEAVAASSEPSKKKRRS